MSVSLRRPVIEKGPCAACPE